MKQKLFIKFILCCCIVFNINAQFNRYLIDSENRLIHIFDTLFKKDNVRYILSDSLKLLYSNMVMKELLDVLNTENAFNYTFNSLDRLGKVTSADSLVKLFTWNIMLSDGSYRYYGILLQRASKTDTKAKIFSLTDYSDSLPEKELEQLTLNNKRWIGAVYYQIVNYKYKNQTYYILIGWDGYSRYINRKIVDVLYFNARGKPVFGKSIFKSDEKTVKRLIFYHSIKASMVCKYDENLKAIVFDHLVPSSTVYKGMYEFYGPNGTYDAYFQKKNMWIYKKDIEVNNPPPKN